ncbi:MAG: hypothetical protein HY644_04525 [Acidobacteria bacterium]|nr:hypothetical protein [Acidobacteriota bacterium]
MQCSQLTRLILFEADTIRRVVYGSANFTYPALCSEAQNGNVEALVVLPPIGAKSFDLRRFVDPCSNAHRLSSDDELRTDTREPVSSADALRPICLREAIVESDRLTLHGKFPEDFPNSTAVTHLQLTDSSTQEFETTRDSQSTLSAKLPTRLLPILRQSSSLVCLKDLATGEELSNTLLITNLVDIETHESVRQERHIREAKESASQFFAVLNDLLRDGDNAALLTFLSFCDIPLVNAPGLAVFRQRPVWEGREGMRSLGERNLQICKTLHEATLRFFDRHFKKLQRHAKTRLLEGIPNFLHIFLSMGNLLRTQIERTILGLEAKSSRITVEEWADCKQFWDIYFRRFQMLMECLWDDYLKRIASKYKRGDIEQEFGPDLAAIHEICDEMIRFRDRIEQVRLTKRIVYGYFHSVVHPDNWKRLAADVEMRRRQVEFAVLARNEHSIPQASAV